MDSGKIPLLFQPVYVGIVSETLPPFTDSGFHISVIEVNVVYPQELHENEFNF